MTEKETKDQSVEAEPQWRRRVRRVCKTRPHLFIIFVISIVGFCYHFHLALKNYWDYKTTVSFAQELPENYAFQYPALTVCLPEVVPHFRLEELFPDYRVAVEEVRNESERRADPEFWLKEESAKFNKIKMMGKYFFKFFEDKAVNNATVLQVLEEFSYGRENECLLDAKPLVRGAYKMHNCESVSPQPIESINGDYRCFTYLSQLDRTLDDEAKKLFMTTLFLSQSNYEQRTNKVLYVSHALNLTLRPHPFERNLRARVMVHSPNEVPVPLFYPSVPVYEWSRFFDVQFWKTVSHLLESPYETNCFPYKTGPEESLQSFDDCLTQCVIQKYRDNCKCLPRSSLLFRRRHLLPDDKFCRKINKCQFTNYRLACEQDCKKDCLEEKYFFEKLADLPFYSNANLTGLQITRKPVMDQVYRHAPTVTLIQLICDFGGLGGLWLGFSVITITTAIIQLISKPLERIVEAE